MFQQEAERTEDDGQASDADLAGEDESNDAANRLEKKERDEDTNDSLDQDLARRRQKRQCLRARCRAASTSTSATKRSSSDQLMGEETLGLSPCQWRLG